MKSTLFPDFGIPLADCDVSAALDEQGIARVWFRSQGNPVVALDVAGAQRLSRRMEAAGELPAGQELAGLVKAAQALKGPGAVYDASQYGAGVYGDDGSEIARSAADRRARLFAATQTGSVESPWPPPGQMG